jgi:hypothetical protein
VRIRRQHASKAHQPRQLLPQELIEVHGNETPSPPECVEESTRVAALTATEAVEGAP